MQTLLSEVGKCTVMIRARSSEYDRKSVLDCSLGSISQGAPKTVSRNSTSDHFQFFDEPVISDGYLGIEAGGPRARWIACKETTQLTSPRGVSLKVTDACWFAVVTLYLSVSAIV